MMHYSMWETDWTCGARSGWSYNNSAF